MTQRFFRNGFLALSVLSLAGSAFGQVTVAPINFGAAEGNGILTTPFGDTTGGGNRYQVLFEDSQLTLNPGDLITGLAFRANGGGVGNAPAADANFGDFEIRLGAPSVTAESMSTTFANNFTTLTLVRDGSYTLPAGSLPRGNIPNPFGPVIAFSTPFTYLGGDLLIDIRNSGAANGVLSMDVDNNAAAGFGTSYRQIYAANGGMNAASGVSTFAPIVQISYTPVPEPATISFVSAGCLLGMMLVRKVAKKR